MASAVKQVQNYKDEVKAQAEELLRKGIPESILKLNKILDGPQFKNRLVIEVKQDINIPIPDPIILNDLPPAKKTKFDNSISKDNKDGTRVLIFPSGSVPPNKHLTDLIDIIKPYVRKLVEDAIVIKMWISFMVPKIEDGNNFGVSVQEETLGEVQSCESETSSYFEQISRYFIMRGKLISKVAKYPHVEDFRRAVHELDEKEYFAMWLTLSEIRNRYCTLHDVISKNIEKIKKPRPSNAGESLY